mmetsp:Transcript_34950/g.103537  ORF Transcript_34950/g.103537 Transcript_34950/m.103537 type:complete len:535 (-) Transcript_34950:1290-2894(-)
MLASRASRFPPPPAPSSAASASVMRSCIASTGSRRAATAMLRNSPSRPSAVASTWCTVRAAACDCSPRSSCAMRLRPNVSAQDRNTTSAAICSAKSALVGSADAPAAAIMDAMSGARATGEPGPLVAHASGDADAAACQLRTSVRALALEMLASALCTWFASVSSIKRRLRRVPKNARAARHGTMLRMTFFASMRCGVSCISANCRATCWYSGSSTRSRAAAAPASPSARARCSTGSRRAMSFSSSGLRNLISTMPSGSSTPPLAVGSAYISTHVALICVSTTTQAPPLSSEFAGRYTNTGCLYVRSCSTIWLPACSTPSNRSRCPPLKPRQFASTKRGRRSRPNSSIASAVLEAESGNHTCPACGMLSSDESGMPGSAGRWRIVVAVSTAITPTGCPPRRARPVTTVVAQPACDSSHEPRSKRPDCQPASALATAPSLAPALGGAASAADMGAARPATAARGSSFSPAAGAYAIGRVTGSDDGSAGGGAPSVAGAKDSSRSTVETPSRSSRTTWWLTPLCPITRGPPSCIWLV